jgi:hypothetical protein
MSIKTSDSWYVPRSVSHLMILGFYRLKCGDILDCILVLIIFEINKVLEQIPILLMRKISLNKRVKIELIFSVFLFQLYILILFLLL